ncbi:MAG: hypothetical protein ACYTEQ_12505 [Planctomycetota bacterium]|jgi:hypothetical protein
MNNPPDAEYQSAGKREQHQQPSEGCERIASSGLKYEKQGNRGNSHAQQNCGNLAVTHCQYLFHQTKIKDWHVNYITDKHGWKLKPAAEPFISQADS